MTDYDIFLPLISGLLPDVAGLFHFPLLAPKVFLLLGVAVDIQ